MANADILAFKSAADTYNNIGQLQNQRLQLMAQEDERARQIRLQEEQLEQKKREEDRLRYAEWEKQQILNSATSRLQSMMKNEDTGVTDKQGKKLYREPSLQDMMIGQNKLAAEEAQKRGRGDLAMNFMAEAEKVSAMKAKMEQEQRKAALEEKALQMKIEASRDIGDSQFSGVATVVGVEPKTNNQVYRHKDSGKLFVYIDGQPQAYEGEFDLKPSAATQTATVAGKQAVGDVNAARTAANENPDAFGLKTVLPEIILQRVDPEGVEARALVGKLSSVQIKDTSGAAVSAAEQKRLNTYLPASGDDSSTVKIKLNNYYEELKRKGYVVDEVGAGADEKKTVKRTGTTKDGRRVIEYTDGSREYK